MASTLLPNPAAPSLDTTVSQRPTFVRADRHRKLALLAALALCIAAYLWITLRSAWREAALREAYLPELEAMASRSPEDGRILALLGMRLMEAHEHPKAAPILEHALMVGEQKEPVWLAAAGSAAASGDRVQCLGLLRFGVKTQPDAPQIRAALARVEKLGAAPSSADMAQAVCPQGPEPLVAAYARGSFLSGLWEWWGAHHPGVSGFATRQRYAMLRPNDGEAQRLWGEALMRNRREVEAGPVLRHAVELVPRSPEAHLSLADFEARAGLMASAAFQYIECLKLRRDWLPALMGLCRLSIKDDFRYGTVCFRRVTEVAPRSADAWIIRGLGYYQQGEHKNKEAIEAFQRAASLDPMRTEYYAQWAYLLTQASRYDEAEALLRRRLKNAPGDVEAHFQLGSVLMDSNPTPEREAEAEKEAREGIRLAPRSSAPRVLLAKLLLRHGQADQAVAQLNAALQDNPQELKALNLLARAYERDGKAALAQQVSHRATAVFDAQQQIMVLESRRGKAYLDPNVHAALAEAYARTGQGDKALTEQQTAKALRENPKLVAQSMDRFKSDLQSIHLDQ